MTSIPADLEIQDRLKLIESMLAQGRRTTERWAWSFVFWGLAYYVAILWTAVSHWPFAWLVTMMGAWLLHSVIVWSKHQGRTQRSPSTTVGRAIAATWIAMGISLASLLIALGFAGLFNQHIFVAIVASMLGVTNGATGMLLRWKAQIACAVVWWVAAVAACFGSEQQCTGVFLVAIFLGQIVFGIYGMICEARLRRQEAANV